MIIIILYQKRQPLNRFDSNIHLITEFKMKVFDIYNCISSKPTETFINCDKLSATMGILYSIPITTCKYFIFQCKLLKYNNQKDKMAIKRGSYKGIGQKCQFTFTIYIMEWHRALQKSTVIPHIPRPVSSTGTSSRTLKLIQTTAITKILGDQEKQLFVIVGRSSEHCKV